MLKLIKPHPRKEPGKMNKTEKRYSEYLDDLITNEIIRSWHYEEVTFKLAPNTRYTPDFMVVFDDMIEFHEVKGFLRDDAAVKFKAVAAKFDYFGWLMITWKQKQWLPIYDLRREF